MNADVAQVEARRELDAIRERLAAHARDRLPRAVTVAKVGHFDPRPDGTVHYRLVLASAAGRWEQTQTRLDLELAEALIRIRRVLEPEKAGPRLEVFRSLPAGLRGIAA